MRAPWVFRALVLALLVTAVVTVVVVEREPTFSLAGSGPGALAAELAAAAALGLAAATARRTSPVFGVLLGATAVAWLVAEWTTPLAGPVFTAGLLLYAAWPPLLAAAALRGPGDEPPGRVARTLLALAVLSGVGVLGVGAALVFDPDAQGCTRCPPNVVLLTGAPALGHRLTQLGLGLTVAWTVVFAGLAVARLVRAAAARRRWSAPTLVPATLALLLWGADALHGLRRGFVSTDPTDRGLRLAEAAALGAVAAGVALGRLRARRTRRALARLVVDVGAAPAPGEVQAWLAASLHDPTTALLYPLDDGTWVDAEGRPVVLDRLDGAVTRVRAEDRDVLAVAHRPGSLDDPTLLPELVGTASLALEHDRLHAVRHARLAELRESRARIVAEADARRRQLERDLHDGAQQRLVAVALAVQLARRHATGDDTLAEDRLAHAEERVRAAVVALRDVAHGLFPAVLADEGLAAALEELSEQDPRLVPRTLPTGRFPDAVESAAYFATLESLRRSDHDVTVDVVAAQGRLELEIDAGDLADTTMQQVHDRVGAVGGTASLRGSRLRVEMPCAW